MNNFIKKVYGNGLIAKALKKRSDLGAYFFAAGVSDSMNAIEDDYKREFSELGKFIQKFKNEKICYFSSFVAVNGHSRYAQHKRNIEEFIATNALSYNIIRLPQVVGISKNATLVSFLVKKIIFEEEVLIQKNASRRLVSIEDITRIASIIANKSEDKLVINVGPINSITVDEIVNQISKILRIKLKYKEDNGGDAQDVPLEDILRVLGGDDPIFNSNYQYGILEKYVPHIAANFREFNVVN